MRKFNPTTQIGELLQNTTFGEMAKSNKVGQIMKHSTIFSFWHDIVGVKFAKFTKPYSIKYNKLYVSAKSPVIVQELNLYKIKILKKINSYSMPLGIEIKDVVFNYKNYSVSTPQTLNQVEDKPIEILSKDIENIKIPSEVEAEIEKNINKIKFLNENQKKDFIRKIIDNQKAKQLQNNKIH